MTYREALEALFALRRFGVKPGLGPMQRLLDRLGRPERAFAVVHVAGTNGKGSTAAFIEAIVRASGRRVGLYTSPHLSRFTERMRVDGVEVGEEEAAALAGEVLGVAEEGTTFFEIVTGMALSLFRRRGVEVAVIEAGLGGRLDSTNAIEATRVSVVTSIGHDHLDVLGPTLVDVALEKAGIFRPGVPAVVAASGAPLVAIEEVAREVGAPLSRLGQEVRVAPHGRGLDYDGPGGPLVVDALALAGAYQRSNAALALAAVALAGIEVGDAARAAGLRSASWPGRFERLADDLVVDGAHNPEGAAALAEALADETRPVTLVFGALGDKDACGTLRPLVALPRLRRVVLTRPESPRALDPSLLVAGWGAGVPVRVEASAARALEVARAEAAGEGGVVVVAGSLFLVGAVRRLVTGERADPLVVQDPMGVRPRP